MKRLSQLLIIALAGAGLTLAACESEEAEPEEDDQEVEEPLEEDEEDDEEGEDDDEEEEAEYDEDLFILAAFEMECVDQEIDDEEQAGEIEEEILARYGFTDESYEEAADEFRGQESTEIAIETRMERCDEDFAEALAEEGSEDIEEEEDEDEEAAQPRPEPPMTGELSADITGNDFEDTTLTMTVRRNFDLRGELRGTKEGRDILVPFRGKVSENGNIQASGDRRGNSVELDGRLNSNRAEGNLSGEIHERSFRTRYRAE